MSKIAVIACVYNSLPLVKEAISAAIDQSRGDETFFFLVDNHSPDPQVGPWIRQLRGRVTVVEPGRNLGCHGGWNFGREKALETVRAGVPSFDYFVKLDDDTVVQTEGWDSLMAKALERLEDYAFISADGDCQRTYFRTDGEWKTVTVNGVQVKRPIDKLPQYDVSFSLAMFKPEALALFGPMQNALVTSNDPQKQMLGKVSLYGGEELYYGRLAERHRLQTGVLPSVYWHHLGNESRHPDYPMWKWVHGYMGWTLQSMDAWIRSPEYLPHYRKRIQMELNHEHPNDAHLCYLCGRIGDVGTSRVDLEAMKTLAEIAENVVLKETCAKAAEKLSVRLGDAK